MPFRGRSLSRTKSDKVQVEQKPPLAREELRDSGAPAHDAREIGPRHSALLQHEGNDALGRSCLVDCDARSIARRSNKR